LFVRYFPTISSLGVLSCLATAPQWDLLYLPSHTQLCNCANYH
jgi:hypothetical protein